MIGAVGVLTNAPKAHGMWYGTCVAPPGYGYQQAISRHRVRVARTNRSAATVFRLGANGTRMHVAGDSGVVCRHGARRHLFERADRVQLD